MEILGIYERLNVLAALHDDDFTIASTAESELEMIVNGEFKPGHKKFFGQLSGKKCFLKKKLISNFDETL